MIVEVEFVGLGTLVFMESFPCGQREVSQLKLFWVKEVRE